MNYLFTLVLSLFVQVVLSQDLIFSNTNLKSYLLSEKTVDLDGDEIPDTLIDLNGDKEIQLSEALLVHNLVISPGNSTIITSVQDLHQFSNLRRLSIPGDFGLTEVSNLNLASLQHIRISDHNSITNIDLSDLPNLTRIYLEGLDGVQNLNLQNGTYATEGFSLFYTYVQFACVDSIEAEYNTVAQHLVNGGIITMNCVLGTIKYNISDLDVFPNPSNGILNFNQKFASAQLYDFSGKLLKTWDKPLDRIDISLFGNGIFMLRVKLQNQAIIEKKIIRN